MKNKNQVLRAPGLSLFATASNIHVPSFLYVYKMQLHWY